MGGHIRQKSARRPLPEHLPRERVVVPAPTTCRCCGGRRLVKIGEIVTETLDLVPRRRFARPAMRETFTWRDGDDLRAAAPFHAILRGRVGASLREHAAPLVGDLVSWMKSERAKLSRHADVARVMDYRLKRWPAFTRFLDGRRGRASAARHGPRPEIVALRRPGARPPSRRAPEYPERNRQAQRQRPTGLAR